MVLSHTARPRKPLKPLVCAGQGGCVPVLHNTHPRALQAWGSPPAHPALLGIVIFSLLGFPVLGKICPYCSACCTVPAGCCSSQQEQTEAGPGSAGWSFTCIMNMF